jgi:EAL domain-containing protein (putative c-di-GMP-specific phosphodiesterase class I)
VNVSASGLKRPGLIDDIATAIEASGIAPHDLVLEVTESVLIENADSALLQLERLKSLGVRLALDDFGTGYSSLAYLQRFPFDHVKLDTSFTSALPESSRAMRLVEAIHHVATALDMHGIAEGVERPDQARALRDLGWEFAQGFLYSRPVDASVAAGLIRAARDSRRHPGQKPATDPRVPSRPPPAVSVVST